LLRAKAARARTEGVTRQDRWLGHVDVVGPLGAATAPLSNWANAFKPHRKLMKAVVGVHPDRNLPRFHRQTFARWFGKRAAHTPPTPARPVAFFYSCSVNYHEPEVGRDAVAVLEKNGCQVSCPEQVCCGMPFLDAGDIDAATRNARKNVAALLPLVEAGAAVIVPQPTCSYVLKHEYPRLAPGPDTERVARVRLIYSST
jgi:glycerol-3-phosphate dehydrogenase subunit C